MDKEDKRRHIPTRLPLWQVRCNYPDLSISEHEHDQVVRDLLRVFGGLLASATGDEFETIVAAIDKARALQPQQGATWPGIVIHDRSLPVSWHLVKTPPERRPGW